jgi:hypothetical protein
MRRSEKYAGSWVALDQVRYDARHQPIDAHVVDFDSNLGTLCARMRANHCHSCAVLYCEPYAEHAPAARRALSH